MVGNSEREEIPNLDPVINVILDVLTDWFPSLPKAAREGCAARIASQLFPEPDSDDLHRWTIYVP